MSEEKKKEGKEENKEGKGKVDTKYHNKILEIVKKHLKENVADKIEDLEIKDVSGMSNANFIVNHRDKDDEKVVVRFFKGKCSNFDNERKIFKLMGDKGIGPKELEANDEFRVEECIQGRPLTWLELRNPFIQQKLMEMICDTNYDKDLPDVILQSDKPDAHLLLDVTMDKQEGWYHKYVNESRPKLKQQDLTKYPRAKDILDFFDKVLEDEAAFIKEYEGLAPKDKPRKEIDIVFCHNDF